jgi:hypothetical protein
MQSAFLVQTVAMGLAFFASSCENQGYHANSAAEARAYAKRAVETGVVHAGGEQDLFQRKAAGKPAAGKWSPQKIEKFVARWISENPRRAEINLAATKGLISERDRLQLTSALDELEAAEMQRQAAAMQIVAGSLNSTAASLNQSAAAMNQSAAAYRSITPSSYITPVRTPQRIDLRPTYNGGYSGTIYP